MNNRDLYTKLKNELKEQYRIGLHHVSIHEHLLDRYGTIDSVLNEKNVADNIIKKGLIVHDHGVGLSSTVRFLDANYNESDFNYFYNLIKNDYVYTVIIAIPYYISYSGKKYFIGGNGSANISNNILFNYVLDSAFVYGYYKRNAKDIDSEIIFDENLELNENPNFWSKNTDEENDKIIDNILRNKKYVLSAIKIANSFVPKSLVIHPERFFINETKRQLKMTLKRDDKK